MDTVLDRAGRALHDAHSARLALFVIDHTDIVLDRDRAEFARPRANAAADARDIAALLGVSAFLRVVAADDDFGLAVGNDLDQLVRACLDACAAAGALAAVNDGDAAFCKNCGKSV